MGHFRQSKGVGLAVLLLAACGGGGGGSGTGAKPPEQLPGEPEGPRYTLAVRGGDGISQGGGGGRIEISAHGMGIRLKKNGALPELPSPGAAQLPALGQNPMTVASDQQLVVADEILIEGAPITGLWVKEGATLTLQPESGGEAVFSLPDGLIVDGKIAMARLTGEPSACSLAISAASAAIAGTIDARGADGAGSSAGGDGGRVTLEVSGGFSLSGAILTQGGEGSTGGDGGAVFVGLANQDGRTPSSGDVVISGVIDSSGGEGLVEGGGAGGATQFQASFADVTCNLFQSGSIRTRGGDGVTGGGHAGLLSLQTCVVGGLVNTGTLDASGGSASEEGPGGHGGPVTLRSFHRVLHARGTISSVGGGGAGRPPAGDGGAISIGSDYLPFSHAPAMGVHLAAHLDASGGTGEASDTGGHGGAVSIASGSAVVVDETSPGITLYGVELGNASGGGVFYGKGGSGGQVLLELTAVPHSVRGGDLAGAIVSDAGFDVSGGAGGSGNGGEGGTIEMAVRPSSPEVSLLDAEGVTVESKGRLAALGGAGTGGGGSGGTVILDSASLLSTTGELALSGGAAVSGAGGAAGAAMAKAVTASVIGPILASGGKSDGANGGPGGTIDVSGRATASLGLVTADGGASGTGTGGNGGEVSLTWNATPTKTISLRPGTGSRPGVAGQLWLNLQPVTLIDGQYVPAAP